MSATISTVERVFKLGALELPDPIPGGSLAQAVRLLSQQYPQFRHTSIYEEDGKLNASGKLVFDLILPAPKTKG